MNNIVPKIVENETEENIRDCEEVVDALPANPFFTFLDFIAGFGSICAFYFDVVTDVALMWFYFYGEHYIYFALTSLFVILPALVTNIVSIKWYLSDAKCIEIPKASSFTWSLRIIFHVLFMGTVWRTIECLKYGIKSLIRSKPDRRRQHYAYSIYLDADTSLLKLIEAFMESAPQLVLQLYILIKEAQVFRLHIERGFLYFHGNSIRNPPNRIGNLSKITGSDDTFLLEGSKATVIFQVLSVISAIISLSLALTFYARSSRFSLGKKKNISLLGSFFFFCWRLLTVGARVLALSLFASVFNFWFSIVVAIRWIVMTCWIVVQRATLSDNKCLQHCFEMVFGLVYLFTYINLKDEPTRRKYLFFYSYEVIEDAILVALWAWVVDPTTTYFYWCALISHFGGVLLGLTCMIIYYAQFHPNGPRKDLRIMVLTALLPPKVDEPKQNGVPKKFKRCEMASNCV